MRKSKHNIQDVRKKIENKLNIDLKSKNRNRTNVYARATFCYYTRILTDYSLQQIGKEIGRGHASVINSLNIFEEQREYEEMQEIELKVSSVFNESELKLARRQQREIKRLLKENKRLEKLLEEKRKSEYLKLNAPDQIIALTNMLDETGVVEATKRLEPFVRMYNQRKTYENTTREQRG